MKLQQFIEECGFETRSYSGRGMFGKECLGVTIEDSLLHFVAELLDLAEEMSDVKNLATALQNARTDSMGLGTIIYFPYIPYKEN